MGRQGAAPRHPLRGRVGSTTVRGRGARHRHGHPFHFHGRPGFPDGVVPASPGQPDSGAGAPVHRAGHVHLCRRCSRARLPALAGCSGSLSSPRSGELQGCDLHIYSDNTGAESCLRKGAAKSFDHSCIVHSMWKRAVELDVDLAVFRVPTAENLADLPSRRARARPRGAAGWPRAQRVAGGTTNSCYASARCARARGSTKSSGTRMPGALSRWPASSASLRAMTRPGAILRVGASRFLICRRGKALGAPPRLSSLCPAFCRKRSARGQCLRRVARIVWRAARHHVVIR